FTIGTHGNRDEVCDQYQVYFDEQVEKENPLFIDELNRLATIALGKTLRLKCFCAPKRCHGDTIKNALLKAGAEALEV
ncbi:MAG: DUF4326 domain-containing protein, partial [Acinetobacter sp.]|nr:DUF4326 domain-containing protein [Acinetobacter sp.]